MTTPTDAGATTPTHAPAAPGKGRVAEIVGGHLLFYLFVWTVIGALLLTVNLVANGVWDDVEGSHWDGQVNVFQYAIFFGGIMVAAGYLPVVVANGVTRRAAVGGGIVAIVLLAIAGAVLTTLVFGIEHAVFAINDWSHVLTGDEMHIYDRPDQYGLILVDVLARYLTHAFAGMVVGVGLYRFGWVWGAPFILAGAVLAIVAEYLVGSGFVGVRLGDALGLDPPPVGVGVAGCVVVAAAAALLAGRLARGMPILIRHSSWWR